AVQREWEEWARGHREAWAREARSHDAAGQARDRRTTARGAGRIEEAYRSGPPPVVNQAPYRPPGRPPVAHLDALADGTPGATVTVILPEFVPAHWWEGLLHNQTALRLKLALYSHPGVVVVNVPYHLGRNVVPPEDTTAP